MIYGLIPVGGKGTRLSLPYSKEMLPQKNYDYFNPVINHIVEKMELAGAEKIVFVHGLEYKQDVCGYFNDSKYIHIKQETTGFANVIEDFYLNIKPQDKDRVLFGLPDSVFDKNPFIEMLHLPGIVCGLFTTDKHSKVDRLDVRGESFQVKVERTDDNSSRFWGVLKFDGKNISDIVNNGDLKETSEIGHILNKYKKQFVKGYDYLDLGTWTNYNKYMSDSVNFSNVEIEKKYDATNVDMSIFDTFVNDYVRGVTKRHEIVSADYYFTNDNSNIEFIRYRESSNDDGAIPDITIKNFKNSQLNRFELTLPLKVSQSETENVLQFMSLIGAKFEFRVEKKCIIYYHENYTLVMYTFKVNEKEYKIIEIELHKANFNLITELEKTLTNLPGFDSAKTINKSKFQIIKQELQNDTTH